jgi:hypothetical protein
VKTSELELDMAAVEERRYEESEEYEEFDMFHTDRDIVKGHITFKFEENKEDAEVPRPLLREGCNLEECKSFTQQWRLYAGCIVGMDVRELRQQLLNCTDGPLEAAIYDALGSKIDTISETDIMEELGKLAVEEKPGVEEIIAVAKNMNHSTMISEEKPVKQPTAHIDAFRYLS